MMEKFFIRNDLTLKRYRRFKRNKTAVISVWILLSIGFFSFTAEIWANNKPLYLSYQGKSYFPVFVDYYPTDFGIQDELVTDYRKIELSTSDKVIWPVVKWDPFESNSSVQSYPSAPSKVNWMGTDDRGRDVLTRLLYGFRYSIIYAVGVWILSYLIGTIVGALLGYLGGRVDLIGSRIVEVIDMVPKTLMLITIISIFEPSMTLLIVFSFIFDWTVIFQQMRGQFLQIRKREFVEAARSIGASHWRIITKHILPNALTPLVTFSPFAIAGNIAGLAFLDYLGLGLKAPTPSWGELISQSQKYFIQAEWLVWYPSAALLITMVAMINIGLAVRDAFDSKSSVG